MELHRKFNDFEQTLNKSHAPAVILDRDLIICWCNYAYEQVAQRKRQQLIGMPLFDAIPNSTEAQTQPLVHSFETVFATGDEHQINLLQYDLVDENGQLTTYYWQAVNTPIMGTDGNVEFVLNQPTNITELVQMQQYQPSVLGGEKGFLQLIAKERSRLNDLFQQAPGFICVLMGKHHVFEVANQAYLRLIGREGIIGKTVAEVMPEVVSQGFVALLDQVYSSGEPFVGQAIPVQLQRAEAENPEFVYIDFVYQPIRDSADKVTGIFVQGYDVTETHLLTQKIRYEALHDPLTGLFNRREMEARSIALSSREGTHAVLYLDLDHFKIVNDRCGHQSGDRLLVELAHAMDLANQDGMLARIGGDEFVVLIEKCGPIAAVAAAEKLLQTIGDYLFIWQQQEYSVSASIGISFFGGETGYDFAQALAAADSACFLAKDKGRGRIQIADLSDDDVSQQHEDMDWTHRLKAAMREDRIVLFGQNIVDLSAPEQVVHQEVLSRMLDEQGNYLPPGKFIMAAERYGLIEQLDRHILNKVFARLNNPATQHTRLFVNVSGISLSNPSFVQFIDSLLVKYPNIMIENVCIEITETAAVTNISRTADTMNKIRQRGIEFALDDFGSGVATFSYLEKLPIRYVKIDGEFVQNLTSSPVSQAIVASIQHIASVMGLTTIAERIEEPELLSHLSKLGIHMGQGYAIHRPEKLSVAS